MAPEGQFDDSTPKKEDNEYIDDMPLVTALGEIEDLVKGQLDLADERVLLGTFDKSILSVKYVIIPAIEEAETEDDAAEKPEPGSWHPDEIVFSEAELWLQAQLGLTEAELLEKRETQEAVEKILFKGRHDIIRLTVIITPLEPTEEYSPNLTVEIFMKRMFTPVPKVLIRHDEKVIANYDQTRREFTLAQLQKRHPICSSSRAAGSLFAQSLETFVQNSSE